MQEIVGSDPSRKSIRRWSTDQYHSRPKRFFVRTMCFCKAKRSQTKAFSVQWRKVWEYESSKRLYENFSHTTQPKTFYVDLLVLHAAVHFQSEHIQLSKSGCKRSSAAIRAAKVSDVDQRTNTIHVRSAFFVRKMCFGKAKRSQTKAFSVQWRKVSPLFLKVMALWSEHHALSIVLSIATLFWCSLPFLKQQSITFFEIGTQNWQSSSLPLFV